MQNRRKPYFCFMVEISLTEVCMHEGMTSNSTVSHEFSKYLLQNLKILFFINTDLKLHAKFHEGPIKALLERTMRNLSLGTSVFPTSNNHLLAFIIMLLPHSKFPFCKLSNELLKYDFSKLNDIQIIKLLA